MSARARALRFVLAITSLSAAAMSTSPAAAQTHEPVRLEIADCAGVSGSEVRDLVALEIAPEAVLAIDARVPRTATAVRGGISCERETARIWVEDAARASPLRLDITLRDLAPRARPRLLALALAELLATNRLRRAQQPPAPLKHAVAPLATAPAAASPPTPQTTGRPAPSTSSASAQTTATPAQQGTDPRQPETQLSAADFQPAPASEREPAPAPQASFQAWLGAGASHAAKPALWAPAFAIGAIHSWDELAIGADVRFDLARRSKPDLQLGFEALSLAFGPAWHLRTRDYQWLLGPAVRAGYVRLHAKSDDQNVLGQALPGFWLGPCVQTALQVALSESFALRFGAELGYVTQTVRGHDATGAALLALDGVWLSAHVAVSWGTPHSTP